MNSFPRAETDAIERVRTLRYDRIEVKLIFIDCSSGKRVGIARFHHFKHIVSIKGEVLDLGGENRKQRVLDSCRMLCKNHFVFQFRMEKTPPTEALHKIDMVLVEELARMQHLAVRTGKRERVVLLATFNFRQFLLELLIAIKLGSDEKLMICCRLKRLITVRRVLLLQLRRFPDNCVCGILLGNLHLVKVRACRVRKLCIYRQSKQP